MALAFPLAPAAGVPVVLLALALPLVVEVILSSSVVAVGLFAALLPVPAVGLVLLGLLLPPTLLIDSQQL